MYRCEKGDQKLLRTFSCSKCEKNIVVAMEENEKLCDKVKVVREFTYLGDMVSTDGGYETAVTARTRCERVMYGECGELLYGRLLPRVKGLFATCCVWSAIQYGSEAWCLKEYRMGIL